MLRLTVPDGPVVRPALRIAGLGRNFNPTTISQIPDLWKRLVELLPLPGQLEGPTYGVSRSGIDGRDMHYLAGVAVAEDAPLEGDLQDVTLSERPYLIFRQDLDAGPLHPQMKAAAQEIWGRFIPASGHTLAHAPELEVYPPGFDGQAAGGWVEWWIPVEG